MISFSDTAVGELKRFTMEAFDVDETQEAAATLKYIEGMKQALVRQLSTPDEEFSRWLIKQVYSKSLTQAARERFAVLIRQSFREFIDDRINATLKSAMDRDSTAESESERASQVDETASLATLGIVTTEEEVQGYALVKTIVSDIVDPARIFMRDTKSYCGILLDDTNRKPIVRMHFNYPANKRVGIPGEGTDSSGRKELLTYPVDTVEEISGHADQIRDVVRRYLKEDKSSGDA